MGFPSIKDSRTHYSYRSTIDSIYLSQKLNTQYISMDEKIYTVDYSKK